MITCRHYAKAGSIAKNAGSGHDGNVAIGNGTNRRNDTYLEFLASGNLVTGYHPIAGALSAEETAAAAAALRGPGPLR